MKDKKKNKKLMKKTNRKSNEMVCYDVCDPCVKYSVSDGCGCVEYYIDPCLC